MSDDELTPRERRRQEHTATKPKVSLNAAGLKQWTWPIIFVLAIGGVVGMIAVNNATAGDCPGHWHSSFQVYVDDQEVTSYSGYNLEAGNMALAMHMHRGEQANTHYQVHWEPNPSVCNGFSEFLDRVDTDLSSSKLVLEGIHSQTQFGGTYTANETSTIQVFHAVSGGEWESISVSKLNKRQVQDGERVLILYGEYSDERVTQLQNAVPYPPAAAPPG